MPKYVYIMPKILEIDYWGRQDDNNNNFNHCLHLLSWNFKNVKPPLMLFYFHFNNSMSGVSFIQ